MIRYHGVLAAHANARPEVVPGPKPKRAEPTQIPLSLAGDATALEGIAKQPSRHPWAWLLSRGFAVDIMTCPRCRGAMRLVKIADKPDINANPRDTRDHPKGVWTLPPGLRLGEVDRDKYVAIGESDRMTLKFMKPLVAATPASE